MASEANVNKDPKGLKLKYFSRYYDPSSKGMNVFAQDLTKLKEIFCFPPFPIIGMVLKYLEQQKIDCIMVIPAINSPWVNLVSSYLVDLMEISASFDHKAFSVLNNSDPKEVSTLYYCCKTKFLFCISSSEISTCLNIAIYCAFVQIDEQIQRIDDEHFMWLTNHYANPQGGLNC